jgi:hypothetical protein
METEEWLIPNQTHYYKGLKHGNPGMVNGEFEWGSQVDDRATGSSAHNEKAGARELRLWCWKLVRV